MAETALSKRVELSLTNPNAGHDAQHNAWMADKIADGWVYGEEKNEMLKTHHCIVPFEKLPESNRKTPFVNTIP
jgi:hypothetical protein